MSISYLENRLKDILDGGDKLFVPYIMCGDGGFEKTEKLLRLLESSGASVIEIGIPFSDPIADGPSIQAAGQRALDRGIDLNQILNFLGQTPPDNNVPRIIMTYLNPIIQYGLENFFEKLSEISISGVIIPDLPMEEYEMIRGYTKKYDIAIIPLVAPSTSLERMDTMLDHTHGFIYAVTINGTTGARQGFDPKVLKRLDDIKKHTGRPVVAGFGVSTRQHIDMLGQHSDGVVVGSKIVDLAHKEDYESIKKLIPHKNKLSF